MNVPAFTMPENAVEQMVKTAETRDYYRDLSDAEREAEDLPPREPAAEGSQASAPATTTPAAAPADEGSEPEGDAETENLFDEVARLTELIDQKGPAAEAAAEKKDELIESLRQHEDPAMQAVADRLEQQGAELSQLKADREAQITVSQIQKDNADYAAVQKSYQLDGKPLTNEQLLKVDDYLKANPEACRVLSIEEATCRVYPGAVKVKAAQSPPAKGPGVSAKNNGQVATIVTEGASGGAPSGPWTPRPNETMDSAMDAAKARLNPGLARR